MDNNSVNKKTLGRRKIEIKKIEEKTSLHVTFSKRRGGLFRKASELSVLCGAEIAILVQSPANRVFSFGHPSVEHVLGRFETGLIPELAESSTSRAAAKNIVREESRIKYEDAVKKLEMTKIKEEKERTAGRELFWWDVDLPFHCMELHELEGYLEALESLRDNVSRRVAEIEKSSFFLRYEEITPPCYDGGKGKTVMNYSDLDVAAMWSGTGGAAADQTTAALSEADSLPLAHVRDPMVWYFSLKF